MVCVNIAWNVCVDWCIQECELVVLEALKWDVSRITPHDVLDHVLARLPFSDDQRHLVRRHAVTFIVLCITGFSRRFFSVTPVLIPLQFVCHSATLVTTGLLHCMRLKQAVREAATICPRYLQVDL